MWTLNLHSKPKVDKDLVCLSNVTACHLVSLHWYTVPLLLPATWLAWTHAMPQTQWCLREKKECQKLPKDWYSAAVP